MTDDKAKSPTRYPTDARALAADLIAAADKADEGGDS